MTDQEYIKMILALDKEVFDEWEWKAGDRAILLDDHYKREVLVINTHSQIVSSRIAKLLFPGSLEGCKTEEHITRLRPIPSQEQLQKMVNLTPAEYIDDLYDYTNEPTPKDADFSIFYIDMKCFTLAYVMDRKYGKYWNGESWEKEE